MDQMVVIVDLYLQQEHVSKACLLAVSFNEFN